MLIALALGLVSTTAFGGAWTLPAGTLRLEATAFFWRTDERFVDRPGPPTDPYAPGDRVAFDFGGVSETRGVFFEGEVGVLDGVDLGVSLPWVESEFRSSTETLMSRGVGDLRFWLRGGGKVRRFPVSATLRFKAPIGGFETSAETLPLGDGQWDIDGSVATGASGGPIYVQLSLGHRWRLAPKSGAFRPANEWIWGVGGGWEIEPGLSLDLQFDSMRGRAGEAPWARGITDRALDSLLAKIRFRPTMGSWWVSAGLKETLSGRNHPAGTQWLVSMARYTLSGE